MHYETGLGEQDQADFCQLRVWIEPGGLYENAEFESITGESEIACYHAVRGTSTHARLGKALQLVDTVKNQLCGTTHITASTAASSRQPRQVFRSDTRWGRSIIEWPSLNAFLAAPEVQSGVHSVPIGEFAGKQVNYDFLLTVRPGTVLLCHFHGNAPQGGVDSPVFTGFGVTSSITTSMFIASDPVLALDANLTLAWHFGCKGIPLQAITVSIVRKLQTILHAPRVVAWGGSGGGFATIRVVKDVPNAIALVWNPQTNIAKFLPEPVIRYLRIAFPTIATDGPIPSDGEQFPSLCTEAFRDGYQGRIVYLQESSDWHVGAHLDPFVASFCGKALSNITDSSKFSGFVNHHLYLHLCHWGNGHVPPNKDVLSKILRLLSDATMKLDDIVNLKCFPDEVIENTAVNVSHPVPAKKISGVNDTDRPGSSSKDDPSLDLKEFLAMRQTPSNQHG